MNRSPLAIFLSGPVSSLIPMDLSDMPLEDDIYRGEIPATVPIAESVAAASSISSSSGTFVTGRLGALAAVVDHAITRWARTRRRSSSTSTSSQSSSSTSSQSSIYTPSRPRQSRRRQRRSSSANVRSINSERQVAARLRARQKIRRVDREFTLYIPPSLNPKIALNQQSEHLDRPQQSISQTTSLPITLDRLEAALKKASRAKKVKGKQRQQSLGAPPLSLHHDYMFDVPTRPASFGDLSALRSPVQGKQKESFQGTLTPSEPTPGGSHEFNRALKAWWLDVASPTWDDLQTIGKVGTFIASVSHTDPIHSSCIFIPLHLRIFSSKIRVKKWSSLRSLAIILSHSELYRVQRSPSRLISEIPAMPIFVRMTTVL